MMDHIAMTGREKQYHQTARNLFLSREFTKILDIFSQASIPVIPLKGIALIQGVYSDAGDRFVGDIDLLVKTNDIEKATDLLKREGYSCPSGYFDPKKPYSIYLNSIPASKECKIPYFVHLHWHLINTTFPVFMYKIDMDELWREAHQEELCERSVLALAPHHHVIYLALHAFKHSYDKLGLFEDIWRVAEFYKDRIDWHKVRETADRWGMSQPVYYSLFLTKRIMGVEGLDGPLSTVKPTGLTDKGSQIIEAIAEKGVGAHNQVYSIYLDMAGNTFKKGLFIFLTLFPPPSELRKIYGLRSWGEVIRQYFKRAFQALTYI